MNDQPKETMVQRAQRLQAERLAKMVAGESPSATDIPPTPEPAPVEVPPSVEKPSPETVKRLWHSRLDAQTGENQRVAATLLATLLFPYAEYLNSQVKRFSGHRALALSFWVGCLRAGTFPHLPTRKDDQNEFLNWVYENAPYVTPEGDIPNWRTE